MSLGRLVTAIVGIVAISVGTMQIIWPVRVLDWYNRYFLWPAGQPATQAYYILTIVIIIAGVMMFAAAVSRTVGLAGLVGIIGLLMVVVGIFTLVAPAYARHLIVSLTYARPPHEKLTITQITGGIRVLVGILLVFAAIRVPIRDLRFY